VNTFRHGLVIGKFYPPHSGHEYLIRAAADSAQQVTVVVMAADVESITLAQRVAWLAEIFVARRNVCVTGVIDNEPIDYDSDAIWQLHVDHMRRGIAQAEKLRTSVAGPVDAVFTSEGYGQEMACRFGAAAVCLDPARELYPVSATAVRADPAACWQYLAPCVRDYLCLRAVIVGAESTGKTTLAAALAARLRERGAAWTATRWVAEYGREYTANKLAVRRALHPERQPQLEDLQQLRWESAEFMTIADRQRQWESEAARHSAPVLICDTDVFATGIWHERYLGHRSAAIEALARSSGPGTCYILSKWRDVPFQQDGLRDGEHVRQWMHERFVARLDEQQAPWILVSGTLQERVERCLTWIEQQCAITWRFAAPLEQSTSQ
jgi:HTH-type transcriptional regulator, transcriptional repressor of NAD biosynthesis genes